MRFNDGPEQAADAPPDLPAADLQDELEACEAAEAQARSEAAAAKARAAELRDLTGEGAIARRRRVWPKIAVAAAGLGAGACVALTALMLWQHQRVEAQRAHDAACVEAARTGVVALLSIDHSRAKADVQRVLDLSTGPFRDDFDSRAEDFIQTAEQSKVVTKGSVSAAALEWSQDDNARILVAAASQVTNAAGAREDPRPWRMSVTVTRDGDQMKMSDVEFVP